MLSLNFKSQVKGASKGLKDTISIVALLIGLFLVWNYALSDQYGQFKESLEAKNKVLRELADVEGQIKEIENLYSEVEAMSDGDKAKLDFALPLGEGLKDLIPGIHKLAQQSGMTITTMYVTPLEAIEGGQPELNKSQLNVSLRGNYNDTLSFLSLLERQARLINIESIALTDTTATVLGLPTAQVESLQVVITASTYHLGNVPDAPLFPYGRSLNTALLESRQYKILQVVSTLLPVDTGVGINPFAPK